MTVTGALSVRDIEVLDVYRRNDYSMKDVGALFGISGGRVSEIVARYEKITGKKVERRPRGPSGLSSELRAKMIARHARRRL